ncbi:hypothetical protein [Peribacillus muralis]|uniref:hypothetical protein n=1 Tax=Peribacillus muralis TaxID=264697 RepID=UPI0012EA5D4B|nr:hypothetical protein [Peribacillus muralis]
MNSIRTMFTANNILPMRFFIAKIENTREIKNDKIASFGGKYEKSRMFIIGKYKINMLTKINTMKKNNASVLLIKVLSFFSCCFSSSFTPIFPS